MELDTVKFMFQVADNLPSLEIMNVDTCREWMKILGGIGFENWFKL